MKMLLPSDSNSNSISIAPNFHLKTDSRHTKQKKQKTIIINLRHSNGQCHEEKPGPVFTKSLSQGLGLKLRLLSQVSAQKLLKPLS